MRKLLFSVTAADCDWQYERGSGPGGQKRNKTSTKVRCTHRASGAVGVDDTTRSQPQNRKNAFVKMAHTPEFRRWHKIEVARRTGLERSVSEWVDAELAGPHTRIEAKDAAGRWVAWPDRAADDEGAAPEPK